MEEIHKDLSLQNRLLGPSLFTEVYSVRFRVHTAEIIKTTVFWDAEV